MSSKITIEAKTRTADAEYLDYIAEVNVSACYQCGNCSASCPAINFMEIPPNRVIRLVQLGEIAEILEGNTHWTCAACITCSVKCPRGVDIAKVMEGLRQVALRKRTDHVHVKEIENPEELPPIALVSNFRKFVL